jgi:hypothetical protein
MQRAFAAFALVAGVGIACIMHVSDARACGVAYPQGSFAKFSTERALIVWDAAQKTEHFVRALTLNGDPETFGVFVPTPTLPKIAKEDDAILDRVAQLLVPPPVPETGGGGGGPRGATAAALPPSVQVLQRTQLGDFEAVTLKATDANALGDWLARNKFVDKPALRTWEKSYLDKKWLITAVRCTAKGTGDRALQVPTMRMSFKIDAPFFPYVEVPADPADEAAYHAKYDNGARGGYNYASHELEVYVIAQRQMQGMLGAVTGGPPVADAVQVTGDVVAQALGDTKSWGFDPHAQTRWTVTKLSENTWQPRTADKDLVFATYDLPRPRPGPGVTEVDDRPVGPTFPASSMSFASGTSASNAKHASKRFRIGALALFLLIAGAAGFAVFSEQEKRKAKS